MIPTFPVRRLAPARFLAVLALLGAGCDDPSGPPRNLLLVTFDTTRADHLGCYGAVRAATPTIDGLANEGVLFETCISPTPTTVPSHASILTGLYPSRHGARNNGTHRLGDDITTMAERLKALGFRTGAILSARVLDGRYGLGQGFDRYDDDLAGSDTPELFMVRDSKADRAVERAQSWIADSGDDPYFLWVHFFDPHANYEPPEPFATRFRPSPYDGEIAYADQELGRFLDWLDDRDELDDTLVVMTADHGESLHEHNEPTHGVFIYDATTHVPLIFSHHSLPAGQRVAGVTSSVDILPTAFELLGAPAVSGLDGISLVPAMTAVSSGQASELAGRRVYCESLLPLYNNGWSDLRSLRGDDWRYIRAPTPELYDLPKDRRELNNVIDAHAEVHAEWSSDLDEHLARGDVETLDGSIDEMDPEELAMLEDLGYVTRRGEDVDLESDDLPDPKDMSEVMVIAYDSRQLLQQERFEEALVLFEKLSVLDPHNTFTLSGHALALSSLERLDEAIEVTERLILLPGARAENFVGLARLRREAERDDWREALTAAQTRFPNQPMPYSWDGLWAVQDARFHEARRLFEKALEIDADAPEAWAGLGQVEYHLGNLAEAERRLRRAFEIDPAAEKVLYHLGLVLERARRFDEAIDVYAQSVGDEVDVDDMDALLNGGTLAGRYGDPQKGEELLLQALEIEPGNYAARLNLGILLVTEGRAADGAEHLEECTRRDPEQAPAWFPLLTARIEAGPPEKVITAAEGVLNHDPRRTDALVAAAEASAVLGNNEDARSYLARAQSIDPAAVVRAVAEKPALRALGG